MLIKSTIMSSAELMQTWYEEVWNKNNSAHIDEAMHRDVIIHGLDPSGSAKGIDQFKLFYKNFRESFKAISVNLKVLVSNEEFSTGYCIVSATHNSGKEVQFTGITVARYKNGIAVEAWNNFDFLKMYQQLGHILQSTIQS